MEPTRTAILHYTAPPVVGGVEAVIQAQVQVFVAQGYPVTVAAGRGDREALAPGAGWALVPEMDSRHPRVREMNALLEQGQVPPDFEPLVERLVDALTPLLARVDNTIVHNVFTKHFNLPLTAALHIMLERGQVNNLIAWCHDFTWTSPSSHSEVHPGYPWDLLRTYHPGVTYVTVSEQRQGVLADLLGRPAQEVRVIYNGVDPDLLLGLSPAGRALIERLGLLESDLVLLMPVRVTRAKNVEFALQVVAALKARGVRVKLVLSGPPDPHDPQSAAYFRELQALRRELGVEAEMRFVYESGPEPQQPLIVGLPVVGDLLRVSDVMFMPSHYEGFGMPVLEAGLAGVPVVCTRVPAAVEIGGADVTTFDPVGAGAEDVAALILATVERSPVRRLAHHVRQTYTWKAIFQRDVLPLLQT